MLCNFLKIRLIDINQITTIFGQGFISGCDHPLVETIKEYEENPKINYTQTRLYKFHKNFRPINTNDAMNINSSFTLPLFYYPWGSFRSFQANEFKKDQLASSSCGPSTDQLILNEYNRLIRIYEDIKKNGFKLITKRSVLGGTFLIRKNGEKKFVVLQGNHRLSALSILGYRKIFVTTMKGYPEYIKESSFNKTKTLNYPINIYYKFFDAFFRKNYKIEY